MRQDGNGLYEYDCYTHSIEAGYGWDRLVVQDAILRDAVRDWFFSDNEPASLHTYKDCHIEGPNTCNPTCAKPPASSSVFSSGSDSSTSSGSASSISSGSVSSISSGSVSRISSGSVSRLSSGSDSSISYGSSSSEDISSILYPMVSVVCAALIAIYHLVF